MADTRSTETTPLWFVEPSFGARFAAAFIDGFLLMVLGVVVGLLLLRDDRARDLLLPTVAALYTIGAVAMTGRTFGKRLVGLRVASLSTGAVPDLRAAVIRWFVPAAPGLLAVVLPRSTPRGLTLALSLAPIVVYFGVVRGPLHRGLHDVFAGTVVTADPVGV